MLKIKGYKLVVKIKCINIKLWLRCVAQHREAIRSMQLVISKFLSKT